MRIVVLNDGETFSAIEGCVVADVPDYLEEVEDIEDYLRQNWDEAIVADYEEFYNSFS